MKRSITLSAAVLVTSLFVSGAFKAQAKTTSASPATSAVQSADDGSANVGYWAAWSNAASH